ncbi:DNA polymerase subunit beta [Paenibacillus sp. RC67]|uniref:DNA polymerase subunit beta n=1 Tax=Paenibacillus sp. RC67 TaxID=3039392 RepID=UPI0024AE1993|nr:DNA polymerase subunit beta [Paenibacillus sp. RC67]
MDYIHSSISETHRELVGEIYEEVLQDSETVGLLLQGSVARGESYATSDLDMYILLKDGLVRPFRSEHRRGIHVEMKYSDFETAVNKCRITSMGIYNFLDSMILFDQEGKLRQLIELSKKLYNEYQTPLEERKSTKYWLESALIKIKAAQCAQDDLKANLVVATSSWKILEGVWAVNNKPMPPNGSVLSQLRNIERPDDVEKLINSLLLMILIIKKSVFTLMPVCVEQ